MLIEMSIMVILIEKFNKILFVCLSVGYIISTKAVVHPPFMSLYLTYFIILGVADLDK